LKFIHTHVRGFVHALRVINPIVAAPIMPAVQVLVTCLLAAHAADALTVPPSIRVLRPSAAAPSPVLVAAKASPAAPRNAQGIAVAWGVCGFLGILASAIKRLAPIAMQPFLQRDLSWLQWGFYGGSMGIFAYVEGYGAFQKKFSPLVVERAMTLKQSTSPVHIALAPFYSMGLMHATKKRKIVSWSVSMSVAMVVGIVKRLPCTWHHAATRPHTISSTTRPYHLHKHAHAPCAPAPRHRTSASPRSSHALLPPSPASCMTADPWRSIVDAGVCTGLAWGAASIVIIYARALAGTPPGVDPCLPSSS
jgi:hypothetical protein